MTGIDAAGPLVDAARRRNEGEGLPIRYLVGDARDLDTHPDIEAESFDLATIVLAIQNVTPLSPVFKGCRHVLKPGGRLILVMMHPCFRVPKGSDWHWDERKHEEVRTVAHYLTSTKIGIQTHPGLAAHGKSQESTTHFHRPLQAYIQTLAGAGLLVDHMEEWASHKRSQPGPKAEAIDRARQEIPMFLALQARRV